MVLAGIKEFIKSNPDWKSKLTPEQMARIHLVLKSERSSDDIRNFKEVLKKYPSLIEKYRHMQIERLGKLKDFKERGLSKDFLEKRQRMQKMSRPRPGPAKK